MDLEVQQLLKDCLFHGFYKHIWDSIRYLYSTPDTSYSQLMVAAWKAESENKEIQDKVRPRAAMTTNPGEGTTEVGQQIAKLMVTLTRADRGAAWPVPQIAPERERDHGREWTDRVLLVAPAPIMAGPVLNRMPQATAHLLAMGQGLQ